MNRNAVLNMDLMENQSYLQYYNNDPYMQHSNNSMIQHADNNASHNSTHYLPTTNKPNTTNGKQQVINSSMNQAYSININPPISTMSGNMLHSSQIMAQNTINNSDNNHQSRFCNKTNSNVSPMNHYHDSTPSPLSTYHSPTIRNHHHHQHHSPSPDLNHYGDAGLNLSNTHTHIDNSNSYVSNNTSSTGQQQVQKQPAIKNTLTNLISTQQQQSYSSMNRHQITDWNSSHTVNTTNSQRIKTTNNSANNSHNNQINYNIHQDDIHYSYLDQTQNPEYSSTTPPNSLLSPTDHPHHKPQQELYMVNDNLINHDYKQTKNDCNDSSNSSIPIENYKKKMISTSSHNLAQKTSSELSSSSSSSSTVKRVLEKRNVIIFKIIEQYIDPETKCVIKENISKNDEIIIPLGFTSQIDVSSINSNEIVNTSVNNSTSNSVTDSEKLKQSPKDSVQLHRNSFERSSELDADNNKIEIIDDIERGAANALLSLQTAMTPRKKIQSSTKIQVIDNLNDRLEKIETIKTNQEQQLETQLSIGRLKPGIKILAKWKDKNFYPAEIIKQYGTHKWLVRFEDQATKSLFENEIIRVEYLLINQEVMVKISDELLKISSIKNIIKQKDDMNYEFDLEHIGDDDKTKVIKRYTLKDMFLYAEQGTNILNKFSKQNMTGAVFADVDLDNIVPGKRARPNNKDSENSNGNSDSNNSDNTKKFKNQTQDISLSNKTKDCLPSNSGKNRKPQSSSNNINNNSNNNKSNKIKKDGSSQKPQIKSSSSSSSTNSAAKNSELRTIGNYYESSLALSPSPSKSITATMPKNEIEKIFGPIPKHGSKLFQNIHFILTCGYSNNHKLIKSDETNPECSTPFDKNYLIKQIINGNGHVNDSFDEMKTSNDGLDCVCIADTYSRSIKFIQCLAAGVPIISHRWIIECCRQNQTLNRNSFILPAGYSIITKTLSSDKNIFKKSSTLFKGIKFYFGSEQPENLHKLWSPVLFAAQAKIVKQDSNLYKTLQRGQIDIIIGDETCPTALVNKSIQLKIPVVSSEYIVQCLINGKKLPYDASPLFSHSYRF